MTPAHILLSVTTWSTDNLTTLKYHAMLFQQFSWERLTGSRLLWYKQGFSPLFSYSALPRSAKFGTDSGNFWILSGLKEKNGGGSDTGKACWELRTMLCSSQGVWANLGVENLCVNPTFLPTGVDRNLGWAQEVLMPEYPRGVRAQGVHDVNSGFVCWSTRYAHQCTQTTPYCSHPARLAHTPYHPLPPGSTVPWLLHAPIHPSRPLYRLVSFKFSHSS